MSPRIKIITRLGIALLAAIAGMAFMTAQVTAQNAVVNAILFYSPSCPHCHKVIQEDLPPLLDKFGSRLNIIGINVSVQEGQEIYQTAVQRFQIPQEKLGVPCLIVGDTVLVGAVDIPEQFPGIIENGLAKGGIPLPDIPGLQEALAEDQAASSNDSENDSQSSAAQDSKTGNSANIGSGGQTGLDSPVGLPGQQLSLVDRFRSDLSGNIISVIILLGMVGSVIGVGINFSSSRESALLSWPEWVIPVLAMTGIGVSLYMSYVEITQTEAICGPVGDCNAVQQSPYARLFGVLPVGVLGVIGYTLIVITWLLQKLGSGKRRSSLNLVLWGMALTGVLFSIYLTFLEPFVIGATCAWCITSAIVITLIFLASSEPAMTAWKGSSRRKRN